MQQQNKAVALLWSQPSLSGGLELPAAELTLAQGSVTRRAEALGAQMLLLLSALSSFGCVEKFGCVEEFGRFCLMKSGEEMPLLSG